MGEHLQDLEIVFKTLEANGLVVNRKKCILGEHSIEFLGHLCDAHGIRPLPCKVEAIKKVKPPTTIKELQRFLGMINYYRRFIKSAAYHLYHLFEALGSKPKRLQCCTIRIQLSLSHSLRTPLTSPLVQSSSRGAP